jgi:fucose permease
MALLQTSVPDEQRGRLMGTEFMFSHIAGGLGTYLVGSIAEQHGLQLPMLTVMAVCLLAWAWAYARRGRIGAAFE